MSTIERLDLTPDQKRIHDQILKDIEIARIITIGLHGYAGTGKTVLTAAIVNSLREVYGEGVVLCCTTHKAARSAERALAKLGVKDLEVSTIHRLLGVKQVRDHNTGEEYFAPDKYNPRQLDDSIRVVIIDESSMLASQLYGFLMDALTGSQTVLFVGDGRQLPPPSDGKLCQAFTHTDRSYELTKVLRHDGAILQLATATRQLERGRPPFVAAEGGGSKVITYPTLAAWTEAAIEFGTSPEASADPDYSRILAFTNASVQGLNSVVRSRAYGDDVQPFVPGERLISHDAIPDPSGGRPILYSTCEMVVQTATPDQLVAPGDTFEWVAEARNGKDFKRGMVVAKPWTCWQIQAFAPGVGPVDFRVLDPSEKGSWKKCLNLIAEKAKATDGEVRSHHWRTFFNRRDQFGVVEPAAALTIHKSQGSTYEHVFLHPDLDRCFRKPAAFQNRLAYVGVTRAAKALHVVGDRGQG